MEKHAERTVTDNRRKMALWVLAVLVVTVVWSLLGTLDSWNSYEAGRVRAQKEITERIERRIEAGKRYFDEDLGVWIIPEGPKHIKLKLAKGE